MNNIGAKKLFRRILVDKCWYVGSGDDLLGDLEKMVIWWIWVLWGFSI